MYARSDECGRRFKFYIQLWDARYSKRNKTLLSKNPAVNSCTYGYVCIFCFFFFFFAQKQNRRKLIYVLDFRIYFHLLLVFFSLTKSKNTII